MKIAVAGKGGVGKTTVSGTVARSLARVGDDVLALDADANPMDAGFRPSSCSGSSRRE